MGVDWFSYMNRARVPVALGALPAVCILLTTLSGGGFDAPSQTKFIALAGGALVVGVTLDGAGVAQAARAPLAVALMSLTALSVASVAWTIGGRGDTLRWGLVIGGYAAMFLMGAALTRRASALPVAGAIALLAVLEAVLGLRAVALHALPDAERLGRVWRPGGTFEYPPALSLMQVAALPVLAFAGLDRARPYIAVPAGGAAVLAGAVLGLSGSRLSIGLAALALLAMIGRPPQRERRPAAIATAVLVLIGALVAEPLVGGAVRPTAPPAGTAALFGLLALALAGGAAWAGSRRISGRRYGSWIAGLVAVVALGAALAVQVGQPSRAQTPPPPARSSVQVATRPVPPSSLLHGRAHEWGAAIQTWLDRPVLGAGANSYYAASIRHQGPGASLYAHNLPLELAAELGVAGLGLGLALYAFAGSLLYRTRRTLDAWLLGPLLCVFLISNLLDWTWHLAGLAALWAMAAGALATADPSAERGQEPQLR